MNMREEFEAAMSAETGLPVEYYVNDRRGYSYKCVGPKYAWWGFKKSREALVIELPTRWSIDELHGGWVASAEGSSLDYDKTVASIEAAGVKVKTT